MAKTKRICDNCKKERTFKRGKNWGAICTSNHYVCRNCRRHSFLRLLFMPFVFILPDGKNKSKRPICKGKFRWIKNTDLV